MNFLKKIVLQSHLVSIRMSSTSVGRGLLLGSFTKGDKSTKQLRLTQLAEKFDQSTSGNLSKQISIAGPIDTGKVRVFYGLGDFPVVSVVGLGDPAETEKFDANEGLNQAKENVRSAIASGVRALIDLKVDSIEVDDMQDGQSAAEGALLGAHKFQAYKATDKQTKIPPIKLFSESKATEEWHRGEILAELQNFARVLMETPANLMTPTIFCKQIKERAKGLPIDVQIHDENWARTKKMGSFLSVTNGTAEPAKFLELTYNGGSGAPVALVGKGVTFDSGGISLKPSSKMDEMRADMGGAANVATTILALAELKVPVNVKTLIPLCENLPGGRATKPGDVVFASNGKSICVDNTDAEGRLILADALVYATSFNPKYVVDVATLTGAIRVALGDCVAGVFTNDQALWEAINAAGIETGDRVWRMPLFKHYKKNVTDYEGYDLNNIAKPIGAGSCTAAAFLREFVQADTKWMHVDIAGVMGGCTDQSYTGKGMSGRPMRTLVELVEREAGLRQ